MKKIAAIWLISLPCTYSQNLEEASKLLSTSLFSTAGQSVKWQNKMTFYRDPVEMSSMLTQLASGNDVERQMAAQLKNEPPTRTEVIDVDFRCHSMLRWELDYSPQHVNQAAATHLVANGTQFLLDINEQSTLIKLIPASYGKLRLATLMQPHPLFALQNYLGGAQELKQIGDHEISITNKEMGVRIQLKMSPATFEILEMQLWQGDKKLAQWQLVNGEYLSKNYRGDGTLFSEGVCKKKSSEELAEYTPYVIKKGMTLMAEKALWGGEGFTLSTNTLDGLSIEKMEFDKLPLKNGSGK
ncbi:MAG: hypothetical protein B7Z37_27330 [Verrucomicrobia bacterium 12-59-8]|nr:MAG: hypothetical protein B7Z37_27330 [Verrucomicrobia bacterium 12-59-8]